MWDGDNDSEQKLLSYISIVDYTERGLNKEEDKREKNVKKEYI